MHARKHLSIAFATIFAANRRNGRNPNSPQPTPRAFRLHFKSLWPIGMTLLMTGAAHAVTLSVPCSGSGGGSKGLIAAIEKANSTSGPNVINLTPGCVYALTANYPGGGNGLPPINGTITINGYGATIQRSQPAGSFGFRILAVASGGYLTLNAITIKKGIVYFNSAGSNCEITPDGDVDEGIGGGLCVDPGGTAILNYSTVTENTALDRGIGFASAGGIYNGGSITLNHSVVSKNTAMGMPDNDGAQAGGILSYGSLTLDHSTVTFNTAIIGSSSNPSFGGQAVGGGISSGGTLVIRQSVISDNTAKAITGEGGSALATGGGIIAFNLMLDRSIVRNNIALASGGGFLHANDGGIGLSGTAILNHSVVFGNTANASAPPNFFISDASATGGGIGAFGELRLVYTVVHCNTARALGGSAFGGGINNGTNGTAALDHSEVVENTAKGESIAQSLGGGIYNANTASGSVTLTDSKVKGNHPDQCDPAGSVPGCAN